MKTGKSDRFIFEWSNCDKNAPKEIFDFIQDQLDEVNKEKR